MPDSQGRLIQKTETALASEPAGILESWRIKYDDQPLGHVLKISHIAPEMEFYHGVSVITISVWAVRKKILGKYFHTSGEFLGKVKKFPLHKDMPDWFSARGTMKQGCILLRYFHDLRLFDENQWRLLTRGDEGSPPHLQLVVGQQVGTWTLADDAEVQRDAEFRQGSVFFEQVEDVWEGDG